MLIPGIVASSFSRALDFALQAPDANVIAAYRADDGVTISTGVSQWDDRTGNGNHLSQATGGSQPAFVADGGSDFNNQSVLRPNGSSHFMQSASFVLTHPYTIIVICKATLENATTKRLFEGRISDLGDAGIIMWTADELVRMAGNGSITGTTGNNISVLLECTFNNTSTILRGDSIVEATGSVFDTTHIRDGFTLFRRAAGADQWWGGDLAELIIVDGELTAADRVYLHKYVNQRYGFSIPVVQLPTDFPLVESDVVAYYRADQLEDSGSNTLASWYDLTNNGHHAVQATGANQPAVVSDGGVDFNNQPVIRPDGVNDFLKSAPFILAQPVTYILIGKATLANEGSKIVIDGRTSGVSSKATVFWNASEILSIDAGSTVTGSSGNNVPLLIEVFYNGASSVLYVGSKEEVSGNPGTGGVVNGITIGNDSGLLNPWGGDIAEIFVVRGELTRADRLLLTEYVNTRYNLGASLPMFVSGPFTTVLNTAGPTSLDANMPPEVNAGDGLILAVSGFTTFQNVDTPSGWTLKGSSTFGSSQTFATFAKVAIGNEGGTTQNVSFGAGSGFGGVAHVYRVQNWSGSIDHILNGTMANGTSTAPDPGNVSIGATNETAFIAIATAIDDNSTMSFSAGPANYDDFVTTNTTFGAVPTTAMGSAVRYRTASSEDAGAFTISSSNPWAAHTIAILPEGALLPLASGAPTVSSSDTLATSHIFDLPNISAGQVVQITISSHASAGTHTISAPDGTWTLIFEQNNIYASDVRTSIFAKKFEVDQSATTVTFSSSINAVGVAQVHLIDGMSAVAGNFATARTNEASTTPDSPNLITGWGVIETLWFTFVTWGNETNATGFPVNYTNGTSSVTATGGAAASAGVVSAHRITTASSEDPGPFTFPSTIGFECVTVGYRSG